MACWMIFVNIMPIQDNLVTIYNPVIDETYVEKLQVAVEHRFFQPENKVILAVGRLTEAKNFGFLIRLNAPQHRMTRYESGLQPQLQFLLRFSSITGL